jgi:hypothetical protein
MTIVVPGMARGTEREQVVKGVGTLLTLVDDVVRVEIIPASASGVSASPTVTREAGGRNPTVKQRSESPSLTAQTRQM